MVLEKPEIIDDILQKQGFKCEEVSIQKLAENVTEKMETEIDPKTTAVEPFTDAIPRFENVQSVQNTEDKEYFTKDVGEVKPAQEFVVQEKCRDDGINQTNQQEIAITENLEDKAHISYAKIVASSQRISVTEEAEVAETRESKPVPEIEIKLVGESTTEGKPKTDSEGFVPIKSKRDRSRSHSMSERQQHRLEQTRKEEPPEVEQTIAVPEQSKLKSWASVVMSNSDNAKEIKENTTPLSSPQLDPKSEKESASPEKVPLSDSLQKKKDKSGGLFGSLISTVKSVVTNKKDDSPQTKVEEDRQEDSTKKKHRKKKNKKRLQEDPTYTSVGKDEPESPIKDNKICNDDNTSLIQDYQQGIETLNVEQQQQIGSTEDDTDNKILPNTDISVVHDFLHREKLYTSQDISPQMADVSVEQDPVEKQGFIGSLLSKITSSKTIKQQTTVSEEEKDRKKKKNKNSKKDRSSKVDLENKKVEETDCNTITDEIKEKNKLSNEGASEDDVQFVIPADFEGIPINNEKLVELTPTEEVKIIPREDITEDKLVEMTSNQEVWNISPDEKGFEENKLVELTPNEEVEKIALDEKDEIVLEITEPNVDDKEHYSSQQQIETVDDQKTIFVDESNIEKSPAEDIKVTKRVITQEMKTVGSFLTEMKQYEENIKVTPKREKKHKKDAKVKHQLSREDSNDSSYEQKKPGIIKAIVSSIFDKLTGRKSQDKGVDPTQLLVSNLSVDNEVWLTKHIYDDAEEIWQSNLSRQREPFTETKPMVKEPVITEVLADNILIDETFWLTKCIYDEAEEVWQSELALQNKLQASGDTIKSTDDSQDRDDDSDSDNSSGRGSPFDKSSGESPGRPMPSSEYVMYSLPGGLAGWVEESTYLSPETTVPDKTENDRILRAETTDISESINETISVIKTSDPAIANSADEHLTAAQRLSESIAEDVINDETPSYYIPPPTNPPLGPQKQPTESTGLSESSADADSQLKKDLTEDVQRLQHSLESTETNIEVLPKEGFDEMIQALEDITSDLKKHAAEAIRLEDQVNRLTSDYDTQNLAAHLAGIRTRIATLLSQSENGRILVANARKLQIKKQEELTQYQILLTEIEIWLETTRATIESFVEPVDETGVQNYITNFEKLSQELEEKETQLKELSRVCEEFKKYPDLKILVVALLEQLQILTNIFEEQKTVIVTRIEALKQQLVEIKEKVKLVQTPDLSLENTLDSTSMPIEEIPVHVDTKKVTEEFITKETVQQPGVHIETQTGRSLASPIVEPKTKDFTVTYHEPVDAEIQTQMSQSSSEAEQLPHHKEAITISKRTTGGQETIQIATRPIISESQPIVEEPDDLLVEANYSKRPESETRISELNITNVAPNQPFETVFVEPDETTTEVIVDADGTKRIIVKKLHRTVVRHQQSTQQQQLTTLSTLTEGDVPVSQSFSQITLQGQQSSTTVAKGDGSKAVLTSQQYGGKVVSAAPGGDVDVQEYQTDPETRYTETGPTLKPEEIKIQGIKLHEGDITFVDNQNNQLIPADKAHVLLEGSEVHTSSSSVRAVVQQVTRRIIRKTRRIIRRTVIIDGKEHVTEEVVEEPEEVEVTEEGIPRVSINVTRTEDGKIVQEQQFGETSTFQQPGVTVTEKVTSIVLDAEGNPVETLPENVTLVSQENERYVLEEHTARLPASAPQNTKPEQLFIPENDTKTKTMPPSSVISEFLENERLVVSKAGSSKVDVAPSIDVAPKITDANGGKKTPDDEFSPKAQNKDSNNVISIDIRHPTEELTLKPLDVIDDIKIVTPYQINQSNQKSEEQVTQLTTVDEPSQIVSGIQEEQTIEAEQVSPEPLQSLDTTTYTIKEQYIGETKDTPAETTVSPTKDGACVTATSKVLITSEQDQRFTITQPAVESSAIVFSHPEKIVLDSSKQEAVKVQPSPSTTEPKTVTTQTSLDKSVPEETNVKTESTRTSVTSPKPESKGVELIASAIDESRGTTSEKTAVPETVEVTSMVSSEIDITQSEPNKQEVTIIVPSSIASEPQSVAAQTTTSSSPAKEGEADFRTETITTTITTSTTYRDKETVSSSTDLNTSDILGVHEVTTSDTTEKETQIEPETVITQTSITLPSTDAGGTTTANSKTEVKTSEPSIQAVVIQPSPTVLETVPVQTPISLPSPEEQKVSVKTEIVTPENEPYATPSAPPFEEVCKPSENATVSLLTQDFILSEQLHEPVMPTEDKKLTQESPKGKKKRKFSRSKKVSGTPRTQSPDVPEDEQELDDKTTEEITHVDLEKSVAEVFPETEKIIKNKFTTFELEPVSHVPIELNEKLLEHVDNVLLETATTRAPPDKDLPPVVFVTDSNVIPTETTVIETETEKVTSVTTAPLGNIEMVLSLEETHPKMAVLEESGKGIEIYSAPDNEALATKKPEISLTELQKISPGTLNIQEVEKNDVRPLEPAEKVATEQLEWQETDKMTSLTTEPSGNIEMFLSLEETRPQKISIPVEASTKSELAPVESDKNIVKVPLPTDINDFLDSERRSVESIAPAEKKKMEVEEVEEKYQNEPETTFIPVAVDILVPHDLDSTVHIEKIEASPEIAKEVIGEQETIVLLPKEPTQKVDIVLSLEEKYEDATIATPKVSVSMKIEEDKDRPAEILQKDIHVQLPTIKTEKVEPSVAPTVEDHEEPSTPSDIDHGGRRSKKKKKRKDSSEVEIPTIEKQESEEKPVSIISSLAESTEIEIVDDSFKSEETPKPTLHEFETVSETDEETSLKSKDTGYEADKTTVDESLADDDGQEQKKRRKKKRRQKIKVKESEESNVPKSVYESSPTGEPVILTDDEPIKLHEERPEDTKKTKKRRKGKRKQSESEPERESETIFEAQDEEILSPNESYYTISTPSEPGTVKIVEEKVISSIGSESPQEITSKIVTTVPVIEAIITQETVAQTSPVQEFLEQERVLAERPVEQVSVQTSPEIPTETAELSIQTIEEEKPEVVIPEVQDSSTQIELSTTEIVTQTTPKVQSPEEKIITETTDTSIQTISPEKTELAEESVQTITPEVTEITRTESAMQTTTVESHEEYAQTKSPDVVTADMATQVKPELTESFLQTSPPVEEVECDQPLIKEETTQPSLVSEIIPQITSKIETADNLTQTSPVHIKVCDTVALPPTPSPSPSSSEQYEVYVKASVTVPPDTSESSDKSTNKSENALDLEIIPTPESIFRETNIDEDQNKQSVNLEASGSEESSSDEFDVQIAVDGVPVDQNSTFIDAERSSNKSKKPKRKRHRKHKNVQKEQGPHIEKDFFAEFHRQNTVHDELDPKDLYSEIAKGRSRSSSPTRQSKQYSTDASKFDAASQLEITERDKLEQKKLEDLEIKLPEHETYEKSVESTPLVQTEGSKSIENIILEEPSHLQQHEGIRKSVSDLETEVVSKVFTDIDRETVKKMAENKYKTGETTPSQPESPDEEVTTVNVSIIIPQESTSSPNVEITTSDIFTVTEQEPRTTFTVDSILTESELKESTPTDSTDNGNTEVTNTEVRDQPKVQMHVTATTADFLGAERVAQEIPLIKSTETKEETVFINDKAVKLSPTEDVIPEISQDQPLISPPEEQKPKQFPSKSKGKSKHVSSVTIEEVQSPIIVTDTPLTPTSDVGPLSPPDYTNTAWKKPAQKEISQMFIQSETQGPILYKEINVKWNQAQTLERFKNLQNARRTTHLSNVLYLATLNEIVTDESVEQRSDNVDKHLLMLQEAVEKKDVVVIQQTIITTVETITTWLETIEYRIYVSRQQTSEGPSKERVQEFTDLKQEIADIEQKVEHLQSVMQQADNIYNEDDRQRMKRSYINSLQQQVKVIEEVTEENEHLAAEDLKRWEEFINGVSNVSHLVHEVKRQLSELKESDAAPQTKLNELEKLEIGNRGHMVKAAHLTAAAKSLMRDFPTREIPKEVYLIGEVTKQLEQQITVEREKALQLLSLADEYEQTLKDFSQIIIIAEALVESPVSVRNLEHLEEEMQNSRKFFASLSYCRSILESLERNLDTETKATHSELHQNLYQRATLILDKATGRCHLMTLAATKWTILEQDTREEMRWLQVAQQRTPDLNTVTSSDYDRFIDLYQSLALDISHHHTKLRHLNNMAQKLQELVYCSELEQVYNEPLEIIQKLEEDVQNNLDRLMAFRDSWSSYNILSDKVEYWLKDAEVQLRKIEVPSGSRGHLRQFWELKAQYEVHNSAKQNATNALEKSLQIVPISDEMLQRKFHSELNDQWKKASKRISDIEASIIETISAPDIPVNEKLVLLEQELQDLKTDINNLQGIIRTEEELDLYVERLQIMSTRLDTIQNELGRLGLLSAGESDKVGSLLGLSKRLEIIITEELEGGKLLKDRLHAIQKGLNRVRRKHSEMSKSLDQCEGAEKMGSESVEKAVSDCYEIGEELVTLWQDLMSLRQLLHTLPMRLKVTVSPVKVERDISQLQDEHTALEKRCGQILAMLRSRLALWQRFEKQLELVQQSVQEADFMMELLTVQGTVDYERLRKATERLESVSGDLVSRESLVSELKNAAKPLADSCSPEVSARVEAAVKEAVTAYNTTCSNLKELCTKYQHAADLWKQYREAADLVREWIEDPMESVDNLEPEEAIEKVKVCEETLAAHTKRLAELQQLVSGIASAVGLDSNALLGGEVEALGKQLEDVRESLTALADVAECKAKAKRETQNEINGTRTYLDSVQKSIGNLESSDIDSDSEEKLVTLREHLLALSKAQGQIQEMKDKTIEISTTKTETSVIEILELWQQVFRETFQQYHRLSTRLVKNEDGAAALKLWQEYLINVQQFLQGTIPGDYHSLSEHQHLCQVHQNLLTTQQNVLQPSDKKDSQLASGLVESSVMEQFNSLTNLHNETLARIMDRHTEVQNRLNAWTTYKQDQDKLLTWLKNIEKERERMQLRYMHIRRIPKLLARIQNLLDRIPQGEEMVENLQRQQNLLLQFCDDALATSIRMEHAAIRQRISNLQAGLDTWKQFLERISLLVKTHEDRVTKVQKIFDDVQDIINESIALSPTSHAGVSNRLEILQRTRERLNATTKELEQLGLTQEQLKECLSPSDMKTINQRMWLLWHQQGDLDHQLATLCHQLEEKLGVRSMFEARQSRFVDWADEVEKRLDQEMDGTSTITDPKELLRKLETELQAEMALKEREYSWLLKTGRELVETCGDEYADVTAKQIIQARTDEVLVRWERLESMGRNKANKIHDMMQTMLQLEERIAQIRAWLTQIELQLAKPLVFEACTKEVIDRKLQEHDKLKKSIENESGNIGEVLNLCELLLSDADTSIANLSTENITSAIKNLEKRWKAVCGESAERKRKISFIWKLLQEVLKLSNDQEQWLSKKEQRLKDLDKSLTTLSREEIQQLIYEVENEIKDLESRTPAFQILGQTYSKLATATGTEPENIQELTSRARVIIARWETLMPKAQSILTKLQTGLVPFKEFSLAHEDAVVGLSKIDAQLTELQHLSPPDKVSPKERLQKLQAIEKEFASQTPNLETADKLGLQIMKKSNEQEVARIQVMIDEYQVLCKDVHERITLIKTEIKRHPREVDESVQVETLKFEQDTAVQVNTLPPQLQRMTSISAKDAYLVELEAALVECRTNLSELETLVNKEIPKQGSPELPTSGKKIAKMSAMCQASVELVKHLHDLLINECDATEIEACSEEVRTLIERFEILLVGAKEKEQQLRELRATVTDAYNLLCQHEAGRLLCPLCTKRNWAQLDNDLWRLEKWLQVAEGTQSSQTSPPVNIERLEDTIQDHREFLLDLDSHKSIVRSLNIVGTHLADHTEDTARANELRSRLEADNKRWDLICRKAHDWQIQLQRALMENKQFHNIISELCIWLEKNEKKIRASEPVDLTASVDVIEAKYHNFLELRAELERCEPRVLSLQEAANQLFREDDAPESSRLICRRLTELRLKLQSLIRLTGVYTLKLGAVLGRDPNEIGLAIAASSSVGAPLHSLSYDLLDEPRQDHTSTSAPDDPTHNGSDDGSEINTSVLRSGCRFLGRVVRASVPIQALMLLILGAASLVPYSEEDYSCSLVNSIANSLTPTLRYNDGPPPI